MKNIWQTVRMIFLSTFLVWFTLAGVLLTAFGNAFFGSPLPLETVVKTGATIGVVTGGLASLLLYIIQQRRRHYASHFMGGL